MTESFDNYHYDYNVIYSKLWYERIIERRDVETSFDLIIDTQTVLIPTIIVKKIRHKIFLSSTANWFFSDLKPIKNHKITRSLNEKLNFFISLLINEYPLKQINNNKIHNLYDLKYMNLAKKLLPNGQQYIGIAPGAGDKQKIWPVENFIELATEQTKKNRNLKNRHES